jgi:hypothetical protein
MYDVPRNIVAQAQSSLPPPAGAPASRPLPPPVAAGMAIAAQNETVLYDMGFSISEDGTLPKEPSHVAPPAVVHVTGVSLDETGDDTYDVPRGTAVGVSVAVSAAASAAAASAQPAVPAEGEDELYTYNHLSTAPVAPKAKPPPPPRSSTALPAPPPPPPPVATEASDWNEEAIYGNGPEAVAVIPAAPPADPLQDDDFYMNADAAAPLLPPVAHLAQPFYAPQVDEAYTAIPESTGDELYANADVETAGEDLYMNATEAGATQVTATASSATEPRVENPYQNIVNGVPLRLLPDEPSYVNQPPADA